MRLLVVHPFATTAERQWQYEQLARKTGWEVHLVVPKLWRDDYGRTQLLDSTPGWSLCLHGVSIRMPGNIPLHSFRRPIAALLRDIRPDLIYVYHEPYAIATAQAFWSNSRTVRAPIAFYSSQNVKKRYPPPFNGCQQAVFRSASFAITCSLTVPQPSDNRLPLEHMYQSLPFRVCRARSRRNGYGRRRTGSSLAPIAGVPPREFGSTTISIAPSALCPPVDTLSRRSRTVS